MQRFLICQKQDAEGCDYTIGCGMRFDFVTAESQADAVEAVLWPDGHGELSILERESCPCKLLVIPAGVVTEVDLDALKQRIAKQRADEAASRRESAERDELARLQAKYCS